MVDPVMRRSDQDIFQPAHLADQLRMHENAPDLGGRIHKNDMQGLESQQSQGNEIDEPVQRLKDGRTEAYRKIHLFRRIMGHMHCPEQAYLMIPPLQQVLEEMPCQQ